MTDFPQEIIGGGLQNVAAPRPQPSTADPARANADFRRVMDFLGSGKSTSRKETNEQSPSPKAPPLQICPGLRSELAGDLVAAALQRQEPGDEAKTGGKTDTRKQEVDSETTPLMTAPLPVLVMQLPLDHPCPREEMSRKQPIDQSVGMDLASSPLPCRLSLSNKGEKKPAGDNDDLDAGAVANCAEMKLGSMAPKSAEAFSLAASESRGVRSDARASDVEFVGPPIKMHVSELETHLPFAVLDALPGRPQELTKPEAPVESRVPETLEQQKAPVKILKFEMEPAALGGISVRMRVTHSRLDIQIAAENPSTSTLLADTRDALVAAIGEKGFSLHSYEVLNMPAATAPPSSNGAGQNQSNLSGQQQNYAEERGFPRHDRDQRQEQEPQRHQRRRDETSAVLSSVDLVL